MYPSQTYYLQSISSIAISFFFFLNICTFNQNHLSSAVLVVPTGPAYSEHEADLAPPGFDPVVAPLGCHGLYRPQRLGEMWCLLYTVIYFKSNICSFLMPTGGDGLSIRGLQCLPSTLWTLPKGPSGLPSSYGDQFTDLSSFHLLPTCNGNIIMKIQLLSDYLTILTEKVELC